MTENPPPSAFLDEDEPTRRAPDAATANAIAAALNARYGYVPLSERYRLADAAIAGARAAVEPAQRLLREFEALPAEEQLRVTAAAVQAAGPDWLDPDPPEPDYREGER